VDPPSRREDQCRADQEREIGDATQSVDGGVHRGELRSHPECPKGPDSQVGPLGPVAGMGCQSPQTERNTRQLDQQRRRDQGLLIHQAGASRPHRSASKLDRGRWLTGGAAIAACPASDPLCSVPRLCSPGVTGALTKGGVVPPTCRGQVRDGQGSTAGISGEVQRMKESYSEGVAIHTGPELCVASRKAGCEALAGVRAGRPLSPEITQTGVPSCSLMRKATPCPSVAREGQGPHGAGDPAHARKHLAREPGDPRSSASGR
jgi:hypothetical protein